MEIYIITIVLVAILLEAWICISFMVFDIKNGRKISNLIEYFLKRSEERRLRKSRRN